LGFLEERGRGQKGEELGVDPGLRGRIKASPQAQKPGKEQDCKVIKGKYQKKQKEHSYPAWKSANMPSRFQILSDIIHEGESEQDEAVNKSKTSFPWGAQLKPKNSLVCISIGNSGKGGNENKKFKKSTVAKGLLTAIHPET